MRYLFNFCWSAHKQFHQLYSKIATTPETPEPFKEYLDNNIHTGVKNYMSNIMIILILRFIQEWRTMKKSLTYVVTPSKVGNVEWNVAWSIKCLAAFMPI